MKSTLRDARVDEAPRDSKSAIKKRAAKKLKHADPRYPPKPRKGDAPNGAQRSRAMDPHRRMRIKRKERHGPTIAARRAANRRARVARRKAAA